MNFFPIYFLPPARARFPFEGRSRAELQLPLSYPTERPILLQRESFRPNDARLGDFTPTATTTPRARATAISLRPGSSFAASSCECSLQLSSGPDPRFVVQRAGTVTVQATGGEGPLSYTAAGLAQTCASWCSAQLDAYRQEVAELRTKLAAIQPTKHSHEFAKTATQRRPSAPSLEEPSAPPSLPSHMAAQAVHKRVGHGPWPTGSFGPRPSPDSEAPPNGGRRLLHEVARSSHMPMRDGQSVRRRRSKSRDPVVEEAIPEPQCSDAEVAVIAQEPKRLTDPSALRALVARLSAECRRCTLATMGSVFGAEFVAERLHVMVDEPTVASVCLASLASRMASEQASQLVEAVARREPFGLTTSVAGGDTTRRTGALFSRDLFVPTDETVRGQSVYVGLDTQYRLSACDQDEHPHMWVLSSPSRDRSGWLRCEGEVWIDFRAGDATSTLADKDSFAVAISLHFELGTCLVALQSSEAPVFSESKALTFSGSATAKEVSCWLSRLFGPQAALEPGSLPEVVELPVGLGSIVLVTDLVVRHGTLLFSANGLTIVAGERQVRVDQGAELTVENLCVAASNGASAFVVTGSSLLVRNSTIRNCTAVLNALNVDGLMESRGGAVQVSGEGSLHLVRTTVFGNVAAEGESASKGGAVYCTGNSSVVITESQLLSNEAARAGLSSRELFGQAQGGAVFVTASSLLRVEQSTLTGNVARDGACWSEGGALFVDHNASAIISGSKLAENVAHRGGLLFAAADQEDAGSYGGAVKVGIYSHVEIKDSELWENAASDGSQWSGGGAVSAETSAKVTVLRSKLLRNQASGGGEASYGGALNADLETSLVIELSDLSNNSAANGGSESGGGAIFAASRSQVTIARSQLIYNLVMGSKTCGGGAFVVESGASVIVEGSQLHGNAVRGTRFSRGGAALILSPAYLKLHESQLVENAALDGEAASLGGAIFVDRGGGRLEVLSCTLTVNRAFGADSVTSAGGAIFGAVNCAISIVDTNLTANEALGVSSRGGALSFAGKTMTIRNSIIEGNRVLSKSNLGEAFGGGVFLEGVRLDVLDCLIAANIAEIDGFAERATAGGMYIGTGSLAVVHRSFWQANTAGGLGYYDADVPEYMQGKDQYADWKADIKSFSAAQIFSFGRLQIFDCKIWEAASSLGEPARWAIVAAAGSIALHSSHFAADPSAGLLGLLRAREDAEVLISGCSVTNLAVESESTRFGVVNTSFVPPLDATAAPVVKPPNCGTIIAGESLCDPRAQCEPRLGGGVLCSCRGNGLRYKPGQPLDGRQCEQDASLRAALESESVAITLRKPGVLTNTTLRMIAQASGQKELAVDFNVTMTRLDASSGERVGANGSLRIDSPVITAFGHRIEWRQAPPTATWRALLDGQKLKFADTSLQEFTVRLHCEERQPSDTQSCAADGDVITTVVQLTSCDDDHRDRCLRSQLTIHTTVESILSCKNAKAWVEGGTQSARTGTPMRARALAFDVDNLPIAHTRLPIEFRFNNRLLPVRWESGSNSYAADVSADLTQFTGEYELLVTVEAGWNHTTQNVTTCVLLSRTIEVTQAANLETIITGAVAGALLLILGAAAIYLACKHRHRVTQLLVSFLRHETILAFKVLMELLDISGDSTAQRYLRLYSPSRSGLSSLADLWCVCSCGICQLFSQGRRGGRRHIHRPFCVPPVGHSGLGRVDRVKHLAPPSAGRISANAVASAPIGEANFGPEAGMAGKSANAASRRKQAPREGEPHRHRAPSVLLGNAAAAPRGHSVLHDPADPDPLQPSASGFVSFF
jgi:hypothetical protein